MTAFTLGGLSDPPMSEADVGRDSRVCTRVHMYTCTYICRYKSRGTDSFSPSISRTGAVGVREEDVKEMTGGGIAEFSHVCIMRKVIRQIENIFKKYNTTRTYLQTRSYALYVKSF